MGALTFAVLSFDSLTRHISYLFPNTILGFIARPIALVAEYVGME
jgi:hypothetical protein